MNIVVLDGFPLDKGGLSWKDFEAIGEVTVYEHTENDQIFDRIKYAQIILTNKTPLKKEMLTNLPDLKYIGVLATGYNVVDIKAARECDVIVTNIPTYGTESVAELVFAHILNYCRGIYENTESVKSGQWCKSRDFSYWVTPQHELFGKTIGIIGFGRIGRQVAMIAHGFGMKIIVYDVFKNDILENIIDYEWVELDEIFKSADFLTLHCPLFPEVEGLINKENIKKMKSSAILINTSRGGLVVEDDLADALNHNELGAAFLDVLNTEPPIADCSILASKNCFITPHIAWATEEARMRLMTIAHKNIKAFIDGEKLNIVN